MPIADRLTSRRRRANLAARSHRYWHFLFAALIFVAVGGVLKALAAVLTPVAAALVLSYLLDPLVEWMQRRLKIGRVAATIILFLVALLLVATVVLIVVPLLVRELGVFAENVPAYIKSLRLKALPWIEDTFGFRVPHTLTQLSDQFGADLRDVASRAAKPLGGVAGRVARGTAGVFSGLLTAALVPVFTFYFLPKFPNIVAGATGLIPRRYVDGVSDTVQEIDRALAAWIRGQLTVVLILATLYSIGLSFVPPAVVGRGIKMAVLIGTLTGLLAFIPYVGVGIGVVLSLLVCLLEYAGPWQIAGVLGVFAVVQTIEGLVLTPLLVGERVGLGPVGVLLALMIGGNLFGFVGVLLAVPMAAALVVVIRRGLAAYKASALYLQPPVPIPRGVSLPASDASAAARDAARD